VLGRDRFGEKPLFFDDSGGELSFASELSALTTVGSRAAVDPLAMESLLTFGYVPGPRTMHETVRQLPAGHTLRWSLAKSRSIITRYWDMPAATTSGPAPISDLVDEAEDLLGRSVSSRLVADVPVGVLLSGGLDSTLVAAFARRGTTDLKTFTVAYDSGAVNEDAAARATARLLGSDHHELTLGSAWVAEHVPRLLSTIDQPIADPALVALAAISRLAREHVKVAVGGEGADELFFGYPRYRWLARAERFERMVPAAGASTAARMMGRVAQDVRAKRLAQVIEPGASLERNLGWITDGLLSSGTRFYGPRLEAQRAGGSLQALVSERWEDLGGAALSASRFDQRLYLCDDILQKADRASMASSLEMRTPFLDRTLAEFSAAVSPGIHMANGGKNLLRRVLRRVLPAAGGGQKKTAFRVPLAEWLRGPLAATLEKHLLEGTLVTDAWVQRAPVRALIDDLATRDSAARELWPLLCAGAWLDAQK
jgi:asparagine synthase (glutamine-hydrolysing)